MKRVHPFAIGLAAAALAAAAACATGSLSHSNARDVIAAIPELELTKQNIEVVGLSQLDARNAVATANVRLAFLMAKEPKGWAVEELRFSDQQWVRLDELRRILQDRRWLETQLALLEAAKSLTAYYHTHHVFPEAESMEALVDILYPTYMVRLVRADAWGADFRYRPLDGGARYELVAAGPDGKFRTGDEIILIDGRIRFAAQPAEDR